MLHPCLSALVFHCNISESCHSWLCSLFEGEFFFSNKSWTYVRLPSSPEIGSLLSSRNFAFPPLPPCGRRIWYCFVQDVLLRFSGKRVILVQPFLEEGGPSYVPQNNRLLISKVAQKSSVRNIPAPLKTRSTLSNADVTSFYGTPGRTGCIMRAYYAETLSVSVGHEIFPSFILPFSQ